jgi:hypothetical protein
MNNRRISDTMRSIIKLCSVSFLLIAAFLISNQAGAQTLQFSQVKLVTTQETVPPGKVWKIESVIYNIPYDQSSIQSSSSANCATYYYRSAAISINGIPTKVGSGSQPAAYSSVDYMHSYTILPVWLPAGSTLSGGPCNNQVSVIEFTVVP